jgi:uncharacterized ferritin-like protein (DUF455 family)
LTLRAFAEQILFGATLDDKLATPDGDDRDPGPAIEVPAKPARPKNLEFPSGRATFEFPTPKQLESDAMRGKALHYFANHELLALELMALVLLRFPDAPQSFRAGLVRTMVDEQKHLRLYRARMNALGVEIGDVPVNDYFWRAMKDVRSPLDFVLSMSLTFEQANLDFTRYYAELCERAGDTATADVLHTVYRDEIRHLRHGVEWFDRWRGEGDDWDAYRSSLSAPLSPARAKGPIFDEDGRRKAGLSDRFIRELSVYSKSKGRTPTVFAFEAGCEDAISAPKSSTPRAALDVEHDLGPLMMFLAKKDDVVLVHERPSTDHLRTLQSAGFELPQLATFGDPIDGPFAAFVGWGSSPRSRRRAEDVGMSLPETDDAIFSKTFALSLRAEMFALPEVAPLVEPDRAAICCGVEAALAHARSLFDLGFERAVAKAPYSSSGRHRVFLTQAPLEPNVERWLADRTVIVEPWLARVRDLSLSIDVREHEVERVSFDHFLTDDRGRYRGHVLAPPLAGLDLEPLFARADPFAALDPIASLVGDRLRGRGHLGPAGIDMLLYDSRGRLCLHPLVEVNPRLTMGFIARALKKRIAPGRQGVWMHAPIEEVRGLAPELELGPKGIVRCVLPTNDLANARAIGTVLKVE